jgi:hypothetical protein
VPLELGKNAQSRLHHMPDFNEPSTWLPSQWLPSNLPADLVQQLRHGVAQSGHLGRLRSALARAEDGAPLTVVALGNSVTADFAGAVGWMQDQFRLGYIGVPSKCTAHCVLLGWLLPIYRFLTQHAGQAVSPSAAINAGQAGRFVDNYLECTASTVPTEADIIFLDGVNGMPSPTGNHFKTTEKLIRRLLMLPRQPAVVVLHWVDWCAGTTSNYTVETRFERHGARSCYTAEGLRESLAAAKRKEELVWGALTRHYRLPVLSMSRAFHPLAREPVPLYDPGEVTSAADRNDDVQSWSRWPLPSFTQDGLHPVACGSQQPWKRCRYSMLIAAMVNTFIADVQSFRLGRPEEGQEPLPVNCTPVHNHALERALSVERCFGWGMERRVKPPIATAEGWKETSLDTAYSFAPPEHCTRARRQVLPHNVTGPCPKAKPGLTAFAPGSIVDFELPLTAGVQPSRAEAVPTPRSQNASLAITYLSSYAGMGVAVVSCIGRWCQCEPRPIDAHRAATRARPGLADETMISVWERASWRVVIRGGAYVCAIRVQVQNETNSGGTKFKLGSLTLRWASNHSKAEECAVTNDRK